MSEVAVVGQGPRKGLRAITEQRQIRLDEAGDDKARWGGYALTWDEVANIRELFFEYEETFEKGAFKKTIRERGPKGTNAIKLLRQHDTKIAIAGKYTELYEDDVGLGYEAETIETSVGRDLAVELREGTLHNMSIGFDVVVEEYDKDKNRFTVKEARLSEISPVLWGAYASSTVENVRSIEEMDTMLSRLESALSSGRSLGTHEIGQLSQIRGKITNILNADSEPDEPLGDDAPVGGSNDKESRDHAAEVQTRLDLMQRELDLT